MFPSKKPRQPTPIPPIERRQTHIPPVERERKVQIRLSRTEAERFQVARTRLDMRSNQCAKYAIMRLCDEVDA